MRWIVTPFMVGAIGMASCGRTQLPVERNPSGAGGGGGQGARRSSTASGYEKGQCYPVQNVCVTDSSCCSGICGPDRVCEAACQNKGTKCTTASQCCGMSCADGLCTD